jgi:hypothetical protein
MCPWVESASKNEYQGIALGVKAAGVWGWRPTALVVPNVKKIWGLNPPGTPLGPCGLLWAWTFIIYKCICWTIILSELKCTVKQWNTNLLVWPYLLNTDTVGEARGKKKKHNTHVKNSSYTLHKRTNNTFTGSNVIWKTYFIFQWHTCWICSNLFTMK